MSFLTTLNGTAATAVMLALLLLEEAGVPLPFAPGELVLVGAGLLIASGALLWWLFIPLACMACGLGAVLGFTWAAALGSTGLRAVASRVRAEEAVDRVAERLKAAGPRGIAISRLVPGLRIYTTLVAGAFGVERRTFLLGAVPSLIAWVVLFVALGALVGLPALVIFGDVERLALRAAVLLALGVAGFVAVRRIPGNDVRAIESAPRRGRIALAVAIDLGITGSLVLGAGAVVRVAFSGNDRFSWVELAVISLIVFVGYIGLSRRGAGRTAGEAVLAVTYWRAPIPESGPLGAIAAGAAAARRTVTVSLSSISVARRMAAGWTPPPEGGTPPEAAGPVHVPHPWQPAPPSEETRPWRPPAEIDATQPWRPVDVPGSAPPDSPAPPRTVWEPPRDQPG